jgi:hypothetical protein
MKIISFFCASLNTDVFKKKIDKNLFLSNLQNIDFSQIEMTSDVQAATDMWYTLFLSEMIH